MVVTRVLIRLIVRLVVRGLRFVRDHPVATPAFALLLGMLILSNGWRIAPGAGPLAGRASGLTQRSPFSSALTQVDRTSVMVVYDVLEDPASSSFSLVLKENQGDRFLMLSVGQTEAIAIAASVSGSRTARPVAADLLNQVIAGFGARVTRVVITDLVDDIFEARIVLDLGNRQVELDARPSDAIALALRAKAPILAQQSVLDKAGMRSDDLPQHHP